jgi:hypothetical protein
MTDNSDDIKWVRAQRPTVAPPDAETTMWARAALLAHADRASQLKGFAARPERLAQPSTRRRLAGFLKARRGMAAAAAVAIVALAGIGVAVVGIPHTGDKGLVAGVAQAQAKPLLALASRTLAAPALKGDATLVLRTHTFAHGPGFSGADLYLDDGRYFYAMTAAGLPAAVRGGPEDYSVKAAVDAAAANATADLNVARTAFLRAIDPQWAGDTLGESTAMQDNNIWNTGIDVLSAAYGRPDAEAGMLRILATVRGLTVTAGTLQGHNTLEISLTTPAYTITGRSASAEQRAMAARIKSMKAAGFDTASAAELAKKEIAKMKAQVGRVIGSDTMTLTVDARTGAVLTYRDSGGGLLVSYDVSRVSAADFGS